MSKQRDLLSFFKPVASKTLTEHCNNKRQKTDHPSDPSAEMEHISAEPEKHAANEQLANLSVELPVLDVSMGDSWFNALKPEFPKPYFKKLNDFLCTERKTSKIYPKHEDVWSWTKYCSLKDVKVVILGQDPYHNPGQAHGLCFSVQKGVKPPPSLVNMYKELATDIPGFKAPGHGDLSLWAKQGVLLLNACLTVKENCPNSHADKGWEKITDAVIKAVSEKNDGVIFLLWGAFAQKKAACVDKKKHHLLKAPHPSPLSASRGFFGCKHFSQCNELLAGKGKKPIRWELS